jgi:hypothetical protein
VRLCRAGGRSIVAKDLDLGETALRAGRLAAFVADSQLASHRAPDSTDPHAAAKTDAAGSGGPDAAILRHIEASCSHQGRRWTVRRDSRRQS